MVTDDLDADVRGAQSFGMRTALVRTGKFRPETLEHSGRRAGDRAQLGGPVSRLARAVPVVPRLTGRPGAPH